MPQVRSLARTIAVLKLEDMKSDSLTGHTRHLFRTISFEPFLQILHEEPNNDKMQIKDLCY